MSASSTPPLEFELNLGEKGGLLRFKSSEELRAWISKEQQCWSWLNVGRPASDRCTGAREQFQSEINQQVEYWQRYNNQPREVYQAFTNLKNTFQRWIQQGLVLLSTTAEAVFVLGVKEQRGDKVAAGAYVALANNTFQLGGPLPPEFLEGMLEAFLFRREIDWTAGSHKQQLSRLQIQYEAEIKRQDSRFKELEQENCKLNEAFEIVLKERDEALQKLHQDQINEFRKLLENHVAKLTATEKTYDQKLALQKPVKYWQTKENYHSKRAKWFGLSSLGATSFVAVGMSVLVHWIFKDLKPNENPQHWQVGLLVIAAFFSVWLVRILVRMFFSNHHLATDAAERRTMILTYLSMSREGAEFTKDDKKLIVQHLFRSASDGLVAAKFSACPTR